MQPKTDPTTGDTSATPTDSDRKALARAKSICVQLAHYNLGTPIGDSAGIAATRLQSILTPAEEED